MNDKKSNDFYADPANRTPAGPARRRQGKGLSSHVPVRFSPEMITAVKRLADQDGASVSTWIRNIVEREVQRRIPPKTASSWAGGEFVGGPGVATRTLPSEPVSA